MTQSKIVFMLHGLLQLPENATCADCNARSPRWAVVNLGILVCIDCSGHFRALGTHVCVVKSVTLDTWRPEWIETLARVGNAKSNAYWEARPTMRKPTNHNDKNSNRLWIRRKYVDKAFIDPTMTPPAQDTRKINEGRSEVSVTRVPVTKPNVPNPVDSVDLLGFGAFPTPPATKAPPAVKS